MRQVREKNLDASRLAACRGKTALFEALSKLKTGTCPHRSSHRQAARAATAPSAAADRICESNNAAGVGKTIRRLLAE